MEPEDIDDLFRQQLGGHATPPPPGLWARVALPATPEPLDELFRAGLATHATPPRRELWERLEDEHLRPQPRRRRVAAWWQYSAAAVLLVLLLAGGAGLWRGGFGGLANGGLATTQAGRSPGQGGQPAAGAGAAQKEFTTGHSELNLATTSQKDSNLSSTIAPASEKNQQIVSAQATARRPATSSTSIATTTRPRRAATTHDRAPGSHRPPQGQQPDAAAGSLATTGQGGPPRPLPHGGPTPPQVPALRPPAPTLAVARPTPAEAPAEIIEVEVRRGGAPTPTAPVVVAAADATPTPAHRPRLRLGGLLRQADHLVHGEPVSLAEATGLPETVTVQARLGGRLLSRTIQL